VTVREIAIVVPAYNEAQRIVPSLEKILAFLPVHFDASEVLLVDDGSTDGTADLVERRFGGTVRVLRQPQRRGKGAAVRAGVLAARKEWILFVDADLSIPIDETLSLCARADRAPIVIGSKRAPGSQIEYPALRRFLGGIGHLLVSIFVVRGFHDTQCGIKLYRADAGKELFSLSRIDGFAIVVVLPAGTPDADVGVTLGARGPDPLRVLFYSACGALARKLVAVASGEPPGRRVPAGRWS
jgi:dolichyl-phosphate beta-glucosyltransferase